MTEPLSPQALAWVRQSAAAGCVESQVLCNLLQRVEALEARPIPGAVELVPSTPEAAPVATDQELCNAYNNPPGHGFGPALRAVYDLGRQHGAAPPAALSDALISAESALSDIAEGEETNAAPNTFKWAEQRCAEALAIIRPVMQQHGIRTSGYPPDAQPARAIPLPHAGEGEA